MVWMTMVSAVPTEPDLAWARGLRVALVHDWLTGYRGGEKVLEVMGEIFPGADLFTLVHVPGSTHPTIEGRRVTTVTSCPCSPAGSTASTCRPTTW